MKIAKISVTHTSSHHLSMIEITNTDVSYFITQNVVHHTKT